MPFYNFQCEQCLHTFELFMGMSDYHIPDQCPKCNNQGAVKRIFDGCPSVSNGEPKTLGALADKNADKLSEAEKMALNYKHTEYLRNRPAPKLPERVNYDHPSRPRKNKNR